MLTQFKKIYLLMLVMLLMPFAVLAQKMEDPKVDPFTNVTTYSTTMGLLASHDGTYLHVYLTKTDGVYYINLQVELSTTNYHSFSVNQGNALLFKLENGEIITLPNVKTADSQRYIFVEDYRHQELWASTVTAVLTDTALNQMALAKTRVIRITTNNQDIDFTIADKDSFQILKMLSLITKAG